MASTTESKTPSKIDDLAFHLGSEQDAHGLGKAESAQGAGSFVWVSDPVLSKKPRRKPRGWETAANAVRTESFFLKER